jgi:hypothetical protein
LPSSATLSVAFSASCLAVCAMMVSFGVGGCGATGPALSRGSGDSDHAAWRQEDEGGQERYSEIKSREDAMFEACQQNSFGPSLDDVRR